MAKNLKLNIKNTQIAEAINLGAVKAKLAKKKAKSAEEDIKEPNKAQQKPASDIKAEIEEKKEDSPRVKARSHSVFAEGGPAEKQEEVLVSADSQPVEPVARSAVSLIEERLFIQQEEEKPLFVKEESTVEIPAQTEISIESTPPIEKQTTIAQVLKEEKKGPVSAPEQLFTSHVKNEKKADEPLKKKGYPEKPAFRDHAPRAPFNESRGRTGYPPKQEYRPPHKSGHAPFERSRDAQPTERVKLGPTGKHINDILPPRRPKPPMHSDAGRPSDGKGPRDAPVRKPGEAPLKEEARDRESRVKGKFDRRVLEDSDLEVAEKKVPKAKGKEWGNIKAVKRPDIAKSFDARDRQGLRDRDDDIWRKKRPSKSFKGQAQEDTTIRPSKLKIRLPITIKDLASEMKLKASQLLSKLLMQGLVVTLNDFLDDETVVQLLGHEFGCEISVDTSEEERIRVTDKSIREEINLTDPNLLELRPPIVAFMGHVDHGKTSLIDSIRKSNRAAGEAGAITQHIGAFRCKTSHGDITVLDTPGHEAFNAMRARGAEVTDIVVLVVAGDEGIKQQTVEAIEHAKAANATIVVALNKCDKPNFNPENVYRQLADQELLPEAWGGQTITVNCSAVTREGIDGLLEMLAIQAEVLELKANPNSRARGSVLESEMHKGLGAVATVLVQTGTLKIGDALVFSKLWGRVKTMRDEHGKELLEAGPSTPVSVTGLSGLPDAGEEFIVVNSEKEARQIAEARSEGQRQTNLQLKKKVSLENVLQQATASVSKKILTLILRADVQGSLEALKTAFEKIQSNKVQLNIISSCVGEISESDVQLAAASQAVIFGFHTQIESHAEPLIKQMGVRVQLHDIIYHAVDDVREIMKGLLDKIPQENDKGAAVVKAVFKSSQVGNIAGCQVTEGTINRNNSMRVKRKGEIVWKGNIASIKRVKEDVREVQKGLECGILLQGFSDFKEDDILEAYETIYLTQEL